VKPNVFHTTGMNCVLLGERHHTLSDGVRGLLETAFSAVFMVADGNSLVEGAARIQPVLVVVDLALASGNLPRLVEALHKQAPQAKVLLLSVHDEATVATEALAAGADGLVLKRSISTDLLPAVDAVLAGGRYVSPVAGKSTTLSPLEPN
jgi:DNA-binding NarL/FixJ family response regulator